MPDEDRADEKADDMSFTGSVDELARTIDAYGRWDSMTPSAPLEPLTERSLDRLAEANHLRH